MLLKWTFVLLSLVLLPLTFPRPVHPYNGGPVRLAVGWYREADARVYFRVFDLVAGDNRQPETYYFDLDSEDPTTPIRSSVEVWGEPEGVGHGLEGLQPLEGLQEYELSHSVSADSVGVDPTHQRTRYELRVKVASGGAARELVATAFCQPLVRVRGLYQVPGRQELVVVVSYIGRAYGCEEVEVALLLHPPAEPSGKAP